MKRVSLSSTAFQGLRDSNRAIDNVIYVINDEDSTTYAVSPDGEGFYFYHSTQELADAYGE